MNIEVKSVSHITALIQTRYAHLERACFTQALNVASIPNNGAFRLAESLELRRADTEECDVLRKLIEMTCDIQQSPYIRNPYETIKSPNPQLSEVTGFVFATIPKESWRYHVLIYSGASDDLDRMITLTLLTKTPLIHGSVIKAAAIAKDRGVTIEMSTGRVFTDIQVTESPLVYLSEDDITDLGRVYSLHASDCHQRTRLDDAIERFVQLNSIPETSPMRFLGYVSVLESLLTHAPKAGDPYDSLTRQVRQKMILIGRRAKLPIPYQSLESSANQETVWNKLYAYRSAIAHGNQAKFDSDLQCLKDAATATAFMREATISVMRQALEEPDLIADLKGA